MNASPRTTPTGSLVGDRANPHPSQDARYVVEVCGEDEDSVRVRYVSLKAPAWWITRSAWRDWVRLTG